MDRLDENIKEEADGIHNSLGKRKLKEKTIVIFLCL
jgi:hypothetical protein